jgi:broad specificity phosphatase PhoE
MIHFYLVRHGQKEPIPFDPPLTSIGEKQAEVTAQYLKDIPFKGGIASSKLRAKQTAEIIAMPHGLEVTTDERLIERLEWEGNETFEEFIAEWTKTDLDRKYKPKIGKTSMDKGKIMRKVIDELSEEYIDGNILIVSHGGAIGDLLRDVFGQESIPQRIDPITGAPHIKLDECSITIIERNKTSFKLKILNDTSHLSIPLT